MLRGMGFNNSTSIYLASGKIYHAEKYLAPLIKMFPNLYTKESLATTDELAPFMVKIFTVVKKIYISCFRSMKLDGYKALQLMFYFSSFFLATHILLLLL